MVPGLEDLSRLYTARDKQGLQPKLPPLPSCHHLFAVTHSNWGWGVMTEPRRRGLRAEGCTAVAGWVPVEAGQECPLDSLSLQPFSCLPWGGLCVWEASAQGKTSVLGLALKGPQDVVRALCTLHLLRWQGRAGGFPRKDCHPSSPASLSSQGSLTESFSTRHPSSPSVGRYLSFSEGLQVKTGERPAFSLPSPLGQVPVAAAQPVGLWMKG